MTSTIALVVAAGRGTRLEGGLPKQYLRLGGKPLLRHALDTLRAHRGLDGVRVVLHPDDRALYDAATDGLDLLPPVRAARRGRTWRGFGLESLCGFGAQPRPHPRRGAAFVDHTMVDRVLAALDEADGAIPALPVIDTVKRADAQNIITDTVDRAGLWRVQTPQGFLYDKILAAHRASRAAIFPTMPPSPSKRASR